MIDKLIRARIIEIFVVIILVIATLPIWHNFDEKVSAATVNSYDNLNLNFYTYKYNNSDRIIVNNSHDITKKYKINIVTKNQISNDTIIEINNKKYSIGQFYQLRKNQNYIYTIVNNEITHDQKLYEIKHNLKENGVKFTYNFEEEDNF